MRVSWRLPWSLWLLLLLLLLVLLMLMLEDVGAVGAVGAFVLYVYGGRPPGPRPALGRPTPRATEPTPTWAVHPHPPNTTTTTTRKQEPRAQSVAAARLSPSPPSPCRLSNCAYDSPTRPAPNPAPLDITAFNPAPLDIISSADCRSKPTMMLPMTLRNPAMTMRRRPSPLRPASTTCKAINRCHPNRCTGRCTRRRRRRPSLRGCAWRRGRRRSKNGTPKFRERGSDSPRCFGSVRCSRPAPCSAFTTWPSGAASGGRASARGGTRRIARERSDDGGGTPASSTRRTFRGRRVPARRGGAPSAANSTAPFRF